ncbi:MAG: peptidylprolyl isomerase [Pseudomonadota bacterium]
MKSTLSRFLSIVSAVLLFALTAAGPAHAQGTMVRLHTTQGPMDIRLLDGEAPITAANFLAYVRGGNYVNSMVHRSARNPDGSSFVIQGGGYIWPEGPTCCAMVTSRGQIQNEFSPSRSNVRGTVAMAKVGNQPNSATSQWFVNLGNNTFLDASNGGFTVFGRLTTPGLELADRIGALPRVTYLGSPFNELPVTAPRTSGSPARSEVVLITGATEIPAPANANDSIFNYIEARYPTYLAPVASSSGEYLGYKYRHYAPYNVYVAIGEGRVLYYAPLVSGDFVDIGPIDFWTSIAISEGY